MIAKRSRVSHELSVYFNILGNDFGIRSQVYEGSYALQMDISKKQTLAVILVPSGVTCYLAYLNLNTINSLSSQQTCVAESFMRGSNPGIKNERMLVLVPLSFLAMKKLAALLVGALKSRVQNVIGCRSIIASSYWVSGRRVVNCAKNSMMADG